MIDEINDVIIKFGELRNEQQWYDKSYHLSIKMNVSRWYVFYWIIFLFNLIKKLYISKLGKLIS